MEKKQTSVQWLINHWTKLQNDGEKMSWQQIIDITNLALQMEREQIEEAYKASLPLNINHNYMSEKYYTETFKL